VALTAPADGTVAPPGWHMLFLMNSNGVPSVARWVLLGADPPPLGRIEITSRNPAAGAVHRFQGAPFGGVALGDGGTASAAVPGGPSETVAGGHYTVGPEPAPGHEMVSVECDDPETQTVFGRYARIHLAAGETVRCTFTMRPVAAPPPVVPGDTTGPSIAFSRRTGLTPRRSALRGRASDAGAVRRVDVALARAGKGARSCRWWSVRREGLSRGTRSCTRPAWARAKLTGAGGRVRWRLALGRALPPGRYRLAVRGRDAAGNVSWFPGRGRTLALRVPRRPR
jgi:hypothetical protein